ncbi:MAG TPA: hypothetical protein VEQ11_20210 [Chloroflexota bacterium]|nr:hypothetical protein [Chloroflexota bacterium]
MSVGPGLVPAGSRAAEIDCEDKDNYDDPACVQQRQQGPPSTEQPAPATDQPPPPGDEAQPGEGQPASSPPPDQTPPTDASPASPPGSRAIADAPPPPDKIAKATDPAQIVFGLDDAGKEAFQAAYEEGADGRGRWAHSRFERDRGISPSRLGPNVIDSKAWIAKDVDAAKALYKEQAAIKTFPEHKPSEGLSGPNEKFKYTDNVAEETSVTSMYWESNTIWQHYRIVVRKGTNVAILYLFGREDLFFDKNKQSNGLVDWFARKFAGRL